jgi:CRP-like cAMP-binding protein
VGMARTGDEDSQNGESMAKLAAQMAAETLVEHCPTRELCPMGQVCAKCCGEGAIPLYPSVTEVSHGDVIWSDIKFEQRAGFIRSGAFSCFSNTESAGDKSPISILGAGDSAGFAELFTQRELSSSYLVQALSPGMVCFFPAKPLRRLLSLLPQDEHDNVLTSALVNTSAAIYAQVKMLTHARTSDRIAMLLGRVFQLARRQGVDLKSVELTHREVAFLVCADRATTTRALHEMQREGLVDLGYGSITLRDSLIEKASDLMSEFTFVQKKEPSGQL